MKFLICTIISTGIIEITVGSRHFRQKYMKCLVAELQSMRTRKRFVARQNFLNKLSHAFGTIAMQLGAHEICTQSAT